MTRRLLTSSLILIALCASFTARASDNAQIAGGPFDAFTGNSIGGAAPPRQNASYYDSVATYAPNAAGPIYYPPTYAPPVVQHPTYIDNESGDYCRQYSKHVRIDGHRQEVYGTACVQEDGSWRIVE